MRTKDFMPTYVASFCVWLYSVRAFWYCFRDFIGSSTLRLGMRSLRHILQLVGDLCGCHKIRFIQRLGFQDILSGLILAVSSFFFVVINWYLIRAMVLQGRKEAWFNSFNLIVEASLQEQNVG